MRSSAFAAAIAATLLLCPPAAAQAARHDADAVVAAIAYQVVPRSMLVAYRAAFAPNLSAADALQRLVDDRLLATEARRYAIAPKTGELEAARAAHPLPTGFAQGEWDQLLLDRILAQRFLDFRFGDFVPVTREAIQRYIANHPAEFKGPPEADEAKARRALEPRVRERRERSYLAELRDRVAVRVVREALPAD